MSEFRVCYDHNPTDNYFYHPANCDACRMQAEITRLRAELAENPSPAKVPEGYVLVPQRELDNLELCRIALYNALEPVLNETQMLELTNITGQIWRVANTKWNYRYKAMLKSQGG